MCIFDRQIIAWMPSAFFKRAYTVYLYWSTRPTHTDGSDHSFHTCRPSVHPNFSKNRAKLYDCYMENVITTGETVGLAEGIIDDTFLYPLYF